jgi:hypothetical protein
MTVKKKPAAAGAIGKSAARAGAARNALDKSALLGLAGVIERFERRGEAGASTPGRAANERED